MNQTTSTDTRNQDPAPAAPGGGEPNDPAEGPREDKTGPDNTRPAEAAKESKVPSTHVPDTRSFDL